MAKEFAKAFYNSKQWQRQREYILKRDHYLCTEPNCHNIATEVHHIIELNEKNIDDINIRLGEDNLRSLCHACHDSITKQMKSKKENILPNIIFSQDGYPIESESP